MRLDVGVLGPEERRQPLACELLDLVDDLVAAVVAASRVALGVLVGQHRAGGCKDRGGREVLAGDELQGRALAVQLVAEQAGDLGIAAEPVAEGG